MAREIFVSPLVARKIREVNDRIKIGMKLRHRGSPVDLWEVVADVTSRKDWRSLYGSKAFHLRAIHSTALGSINEAALWHKATLVDLIVHTYDLAMGNEWEILIEGE